MPNSTVHHRVQQALASLAEDQTPKGQKIFQSASLYAQHMPAREVELIAQENLVEHLKKVGASLLQAPDATPRVSVTNPTYTPHTVVEVHSQDQPFLVDTVWMQIQAENMGIHHSFHPVLSVQRTKAGVFKKVQYGNTPLKEGQQEAFIHVEIDRQSHAEKREKLAQNIETALAHAQQAYRDFPAMIQHLQKVIQQLEKRPELVKKQAENIDFLKWLQQDNFIFLGVRSYKMTYPKAADQQPTLQVIKNSGLGLLRRPSRRFKTPQKWNDIAPNLRYYLEQESCLTVTKTLEKSVIHRHADMDYISVREHNEAGQVTTEHRFIGLFSAKAYTTPAQEIPIVSGKIERVLSLLPHTPNTAYNYKALRHILATYPREELFQISVEDLQRISHGILHLQERQQVRVFINRTVGERLVSVLVFLPLERMNSQMRHKIQAILLRELDGESLDYQTNMGDAALARLFFKIRTRSHAATETTEEKVETLVAEAALGWLDNFRHQLIQQQGEDIGLTLFNRYEKSFTLSYQEATPENLAVQDVLALEKLDSSHHSTLFTMYCEEEIPRLRVFNPHEEIALSQIMPVFDHMGLTVVSEQTYPLHNAVGEQVWLHDFALEAQGDLGCYTPLLVEALSHVWTHQLEDDILNGLIVHGGLTVQEIVILRLFVAYLRQIETRYAWTDIQKTLLKHGGISKKLAQLFTARFNPHLTKEESQRQQAACKNDILQGLKKVQVLDEDRMLQKMADVISAAVRTNAFQPQKGDTPLAVKFDSTLIPDLPKPMPFREIFVYSPLVEGVHLRGGAVARGGLRWSDRAADFRTEVLGLMKAQMTKNVVIVPVGAKGGFFVKNLADQTAEHKKQMVETAYRQFVRGLLSVTDNRIQGQIVPPYQVRCYDAEDPYLVVAADKGTARFSDTANEEAQKATYWETAKGVHTGFWLGDAFASGGSHGYDHKGMGITARGAWESVKHHFFALGKDIQKEDFTVIGIGDMSGDVFGNGMLLSPHICLLGAFNHQHIFVDPNPDAAASFKERQRLFKKPQATWAEYSPKVLSKGGKIYERSAKELVLTPEIQARFGLTQKTMTPHALMRALLQAEVDLLWNGGIGTYVKAASESHQDVADRANDDVRLNGADVRAKVIGEGGNLGVTQLGRVEYARAGGRINTDALDNAAGVNTSDHEVNIKILLSHLPPKKSLSETDRNALLTRMTDDVATLVLRSNYLQARAVTLKEQTGVTHIDTTWQLQRNLTQKGALDPTLEFLPNQEELEDRRRQNQGYTRPELAVLLAYAKADIYKDLQGSDLAEDPALQDILTQYFPAPLATYKEAMSAHPLAREIVATCVTNDLVNRMGLTFLNRLRDETGLSTCAVARAYLISSRLLEADRWWALIEMQEGQVPNALQYELYDVMKKTVEFMASWFLQHESHPLDIQKIQNKYQAIFHEIYDELEGLLTETRKESHHARMQRWQEQGLSSEVAHAFGLLTLMVAVPDGASLVLQTKQSVSVVMQTYFLVGHRFKLAHLHALTRQIPVTNNWERIASARLSEELYQIQSSVTASVLGQRTGYGQGSTPTDLLNRWQEKREDRAAQYDQRCANVLDHTPTHAMLNVMLGQLKMVMG